MSADRVPGGAAGPRERPALPARPPAADGAEPAGLLQRVPAIVYSSDQGGDGAWSYASPQIETILGFTPEEWCADPTLWRRRLHPEDVERVVAGEEDPSLDAHGDSATEYRLLHRDGRVVWVRDDARLFRDSDGELRWHGVLTDITERKLAEAELERSAAQHAAIAALGEHALEGLSADELAAEALAAAATLLDMDLGAVVALEEDRSSFTWLATHGIAPDLTAEPLSFDPDTYAAYAVNHGTVFVADWSTETRFRPTAPLGQTSPRCGLSTVIEGRRGVFGLLGVHSTVVKELTQSDLDFVQALANVLGDAFERQSTEDDIRHRALHDPLTGLPNLALFRDRLGQATQRLRRRESTTAVLFLDLDRFKLVNESLGREVGDELLAAAALRLRHTVRSSDTVARFGADEFGILLEDIDGERGAVEMAQRISSVFTRPFVLAGTEHFVTTSIGIALAAGGARPEDVIRDADAAMQRAKERGRARYELFDEAIRGRAIGRLRVENDLRRAVERDELTLEYQPIVTLRDRSIVAVEALVRWDHPERGRIPPLDFIPIAEENGLIEPIGRWVLEHACHQAAQWYQARPDAPPIQVAVNLSATQFESRTLTHTVAETLRATSLEPSVLALELTETVMLGRAEELSEMLATLKRIGVRLILDDFGTGYSSLAYLTRLPLDVLKVDRSFVNGLGSERRDTAITEAIVAMSHAMSLTVVGEGVETEHQISELERLGCDFAQGFHFSRPVPAPRITEMLASGTLSPLRGGSPRPRRRLTAG